jgi:hypothetical protein
VEAFLNIPVLAAVPYRNGFHANGNGRNGHAANGNEVAVRGSGQATNGNGNGSRPTLPLTQERDEMVI